MIDSFIQSHIAFYPIKEPVIANGNIYFQPNEDGTAIEPCIVEQGEYFDSIHKRISNFWRWLNLITGKRMHGSGRFMILTEDYDIDDIVGEKCKIIQSRIFLRKITHPEIGGDKIYFHNGHSDYIQPCIIEYCETVDTEKDGGNTVYHWMNLRTGKTESGTVDFWELCVLDCSFN